MHRAVRIFGLVVILLGIAIHLAELINGRFWLHDLQVYIGAAGSLLKGEPLYGISHGLDSGIFKYSPLMALLFVPHALLPHTLAASIHFWCIIIAFIMAVLLADRIIREHLLPGSRMHVTPLLITALITVVHLHRELHLGNINIILLCVLLFSLHHALKGHWPLAGILLGMAVIAKPHFLLIIPLLIMRTSWRYLGFTLLTVAAGLVLPALVMGWERNFNEHLEWFRQMSMHNASLIHIQGTGHEAVNTIYTFIHRVFLSPFMEAHARLPYFILSLIAFLFALLVLRHMRRERDRGEQGHFILEYLILIALVPNLTLTDTQHFILSLPLVLWLMHRLRTQWNPILLIPAILIFLGYGGNWEDALGPVSARMIDLGVLGISNILLVLFVVYLSGQRTPGLPAKVPAPAEAAPFHSTSVDNGGLPHRKHAAMPDTFDHPRTRSTINAIG